ncbi:chorismate--pyruvate lyase family protein [Aliikangiella coralliicola]|uniref:chorismate--pyruvate lyase family protein n=1 Tax=Aliikangiella coralliicola TaxID=2592383 RepID=UPI00143E0C2D|nr:chorismate lyase [Aliikangiella coralliicola]
MNPEIFELLSDRGSLTDRFKQVMGVTPRLTRLNQGRQLASWKERQMLDIRPREWALVREIKMGKGEQNWLFARTIVPMQTLAGPARRIAFLNHAPIGKILFGRNGAARTSLEVQLTTQIPQTVAEMGIVTHFPLWQRCSIFRFSSGPLMVTELFLPDCPIYSGDNQQHCDFKKDKIDLISRSMNVASADSEQAKRDGLENKTVINNASENTLSKNSSSTQNTLHRNRTGPDYAA